MTQAELELLERYIDGTLADGDIEQLRNLLRDNVEARATLRSLATVDFGLQDLAASLDAPELGTPISSTVPSESGLANTVWATSWRYALIIAATVVLMVGAQWAWRYGSKVGQPVAEPTYVASVGLLKECRWQNGLELQEGDRLPVGAIGIESGVAEIWFDDGARLILQDETECRIESRDAASLLKGKVVFHAATDGTFDLRTPNSVLVDLGTEYAVSVGDEGEEIHVFEGEVWRTAVYDEEAVDFIPAGEARHYRHDDVDGGDSVALSDSFVRQISRERQDDVSPEGELVAMESFAYDNSAILTSGEAKGGFGWRGPWHGETRTLSKEPATDSSLDPDETLDFGTMPGVGGSMIVSGNISIYRKLAKPLRMDQDAVFYFRVLFRDESVKTDPIATLFITFRQSESSGERPARFVNGLRLNRCLFARIQGGSRTKRIVSEQSAGMFVGKIVVRRNQPDQVFLHLLERGDRTDIEPTRWLLSHQADCDESFDLLAIHGIGSQMRIDELVVGRTWKSVTSNTSSVDN